MLVNNKRVALPAVHVSCSPNGYETAQFYFLDYLENPLALAVTSVLKLCKPERATETRLR